MFVPSRTFGKTWVMFCDLAVKTETFAPTKTILILNRNMLKYWFFLQKINKKNYLGFPIFSGFLELQKYSKYSDCYRLFCFWQILFFACCLLILMHLWLVSGGMTIEKLEYSRFNTNINKEWVHYSTLKWRFVFLY